jgi:hypothetical protein
MFYAIFNSLRTEELRIAFSGGRMENPAQNFIECITATNPDFFIRAKDFDLIYLHISNG